MTTNTRVNGWTNVEETQIMVVLHNYIQARKPFVQAYKELADMLPNRTEVAIAAHAAELCRKHNIKSEAIKEYTIEQDRIIVETILAFVSKGKTAKDAFEFLETILEGRTANALKTRWATVLKKPNITAYHKAILDGKAFKLNKTLETGSPKHSDKDIHDAGVFIDAVNKIVGQREAMQAEIDFYKNRSEQLANELYVVSRDLEKSENEVARMKKATNGAVLHLLGYHDDIPVENLPKETRQPIKFKMEQNGNLLRI